MQLLRLAQWCIDSYLWAYAFMNVMTTAGFDGILRKIKEIIMHFSIFISASQSPVLGIPDFHCHLSRQYLNSTPYARSFRRRFFAYPHAVNHSHTNIILPWFSIPLVLKCAAKILKIGSQIKIYRPKMFLNRDFCMEKLLAREVTIFPEMDTSSKILLKVYKTNTKL